MFSGHSFATIGCKLAISASSPALEYTPWSPRREQFGLVIALYSFEPKGSVPVLFVAVQMPLHLAPSADHRLA